MDDRFVFITSDLGEACLGTVEEILCPVLFDDDEAVGTGVSIKAALLDLIGDLIAEGHDSRTITIELREEEGI